MSTKYIIKYENGQENPSFREYSKCRDKYTNLGGTININPLTEEEYNDIIHSLNKLKLDIEIINPKFLHIIYGGECRSDNEDCLTRRYFWPYIGYYLDIFLKTEDKINLVFPEQVIIILDPAITHYTRYPNYINYIQSLNYDEIEIFKRILDKSIKIFYINDIIIPKNQNCIINDILISIMDNCIKNGGIVSFLNEVKALYEENTIHPFTKIENFCFDYSDKAIFLNWVPRFKINKLSIPKLDTQFDDYTNHHIENLENIVLLSIPDHDMSFIDYIKQYKTLYFYWETRGFPINNTKKFSYLDMYPMISDIYNIQKIPNIHEIADIFTWNISNDITMYKLYFLEYFK